MISQSLCQHTQDLHRFKLDRTSAMTGENGHDLPSRTKMLSPIGSCLQRKNQISTMASHWYTNHTQEQSLCPTVCRQHKMNSGVGFFLQNFFCLILLCLGNFYLIGFLFVYCCFQFCGFVDFGFVYEHSAYLFLLCFSTFFSYLACLMVLFVRFLKRIREKQGTQSVGWGGEQDLRGDG